MRSCKDLRDYFKTISESELENPSGETLRKVELLRLRCVSPSPRVKGIGAFLPSNWLKALPALLLAEEKKEAFKDEAAHELICPHCGRKLEYVAYNDAREAVCPYCGAVLDELGTNFVNVPEELRPIVPGFEPTSSQIEKTLERDVPDHPLEGMVRAFIKELIGFREFMRSDISSHLALTIGGDFDEMVYRLARAVEKRFWELMTVVVPPAFVPLCTDCPPTVVPCVRAMVAAIDVTFSEKVWRDSNVLLAILESAYAACVATDSLRKLMPVLVLGVKSKLNERDASFLANRGKKIMPSRDAEVSKCLAFTQLFVFLPEVGILSDEEAFELGRTILSTAKEAQPFDVRYAIAQMNDEESEIVKVEDRGTCREWVSELVATRNIKRLLAV